jgi:hypothetical protein
MADFTRDRAQARPLLVRVDHKGAYRVSLEAAPSREELAREEVGASCLFLAQRSDGIEPRRSPRRDETRCDGDQNEQHCNGDEQ